ncbi:MAG: stalk domain-containing protein [Oscillospiraceae bacterium]
MKRILSACICGALLIGSLGMTAVAESIETVTVYINNEILESDQTALIIDDVTMIPIRAVTEKMGCVVEWKEEEQSIRITNGDVDLTMNIGETTVYSGDGEQYTLAVPPFTMNDRAMVPVRFLSEQMGIPIAWDASTYTVNVGVAHENIVSEVATVNGKAVTSDDLKHYMVIEALNIIIDKAEKDPNISVTDFDWDVMEDGRPLNDIIKENALNKATEDMVLIENGEKAGEVWTEEDEAAVAKTVDSFVNQFGAEGFKLRVSTMGISTPEEYKKIYARMAHISGIEALMKEDITKFIPQDVDLSKYVKKDAATVQHILIKSDFKTDNELKKAEKVEKLAKGGNDFNKLMTEFNEDTGETAEGYTFGTGEMVKEFEDASFSLKINEISKPVKSSFGYHIIKRLAGANEIKGYWREKAEVLVNQDEFDKLSISELMKIANDANAKINAQAKEQ